MINQKNKLQKVKKKKHQLHKIYKHLKSYNFQLKKQEKIIKQKQLILKQMLIMQFKRLYQKNSVGEEQVHYQMVKKIVEVELELQVDVLVIILKEVWHCVINLVNKFLMRKKLQENGHLGLNQNLKRIGQMFVMKNVQQVLLIQKNVEQKVHLLNIMMDGGGKQKLHLFLILLLILIKESLVVIQKFGKKQQLIVFQ